MIAKIESNFADPQNEITGTNTKVMMITSDL